MPLRLLTAALLAAAAAACGTEPAAPPPAPSSAASAPFPSSAPLSAPSSGGAPAAASSSPAPPAVQTIRLSYAGGAPGGQPGRVPVPLGTTVSLVASGDTADQVHLHGYDRYLEVPAGGAPATLTFTADIPGVFEVELHDSGLLLTQLEVS